MGSRRWPRYPASVKNLALLIHQLFDAIGASQNALGAAMEHGDQIPRDRLAAELADLEERFKAVGAALALIRLPIEQRTSTLRRSDSL